MINENTQHRPLGSTSTQQIISQAQTVHTQITHIMEPIMIYLVNTQMLAIMVYHLTVQIPEQ